MVTEDETVGTARARRKTRERLEKRDRTGTNNIARDRVDGPEGRPERQGGGCSGGRLPRNRSRLSKSRKRSDKKESTRRSKSVPKKVAGIFGIPVAWNVEDCDYDDSEDETYAPATSRDSSVAGGAAAGGGGSGAPATRYLRPRKTAHPLGILTSLFRNIALGLPFWENE